MDEDHKAADPMFVPWDSDATEEYDLFVLPTDLLSDYFLRCVKLETAVAALQSKIMRMMDDPVPFNCTAFTLAVCVATEECLQTNLWLNDVAATAVVAWGAAQALYKVHSFKNNPMRTLAYAHRNNLDVQLAFRRFFSSVDSLSRYGVIPVAPLVWSGGQTTAESEKQLLDLRPNGKRVRLNKTSFPRVWTTPASKGVSSVMVKPFESVHSITRPKTRSVITTVSHKDKI